jgi:acetolactate synthase-1/2/3 large subunit
LGTDGDSGLGLPCLERIAFGFDIPYRKIQSNSEVVQSLESILSLTGPEIIELIVEPNQITEPRVTSRMLAGKMVTSSMEDMNPILDSAILRRELFF